MFPNVHRVQRIVVCHLVGEVAKENRLHLVTILTFPLINSESILHDRWLVDFRGLSKSRTAYICTNIIMYYYIHVFNMYHVTRGCHTCVTWCKFTWTYRAIFERFASNKIFFWKSSINIDVTNGGVRDGAVRW